ncbi:putative alternative oxidase [Erysiphe neolycopersici]|uniref:Putative alternative oxidase n=1 Tax=Erysiphe neolycopersici TaxID=212602 RepID=A0A420HNA3_9PEZI|nr:putative alternative oxidase [Erysiphe neolycopersici]
MGPVPSFSSKWKEVLGFGDGFSRSNKTRSMTISQSRPNFYQITTNDAYTATKPIISEISANKKLSYPVIPRDIIFIHHKNEILVSACQPPTSSSPIETSRLSSLTGKPLFLITLSADSLNDTGRPDVILHATADKASTAVCFSKIHFSTPVTEMTLCPPPKKSISANFSTDDISTPFIKSSRFNSHDNNHKPKHVKSKSVCTGTYSISANNTFTPYNLYDSSLPRFRTERLFQVVDSTTSSFKYVFFYGYESFEWRRTELNVHHLNQFPKKSITEEGYVSGGMKLIRALTNEVLVVFARVNNTLSPQDIKFNSTTGIMRFNRAECMNTCAEDFDVFVVVSLVSIVEKERRERRHSLSSF